VRLVPGAILDYDQVEADILEGVRPFDLRMLYIDPYFAPQITTRLRDKHGLPVEFIRQGFLSLAGPTKELERLTTGGLLRHGDNPCINWQAGNAVIRRDSADCIKLDKAKSANKIDGLAALVNALAGLVGETHESESCYENERLLVL
jgi:phage terminase large subunit-like protein